MNKDHEHWLIRAESALSLGKTGKIEDIVFAFANCPPTLRDENAIDLDVTWKII